MDKPNRNYPLLVGGGMMLLGAVASYVTLLYTPGGPMYLLGTDYSDVVQGWALVNLAAGLGAIGGGVMLLVLRPRWSRVILLVMSALGLTGFGLAHLVPVALYTRLLVGGGGPGFSVTPFHFLPHLAVAAGAGYLAFQAWQALLADRSPYRIQPHETLSAFAAIGVVVIALGGGFYVENAGWVTTTMPKNQAREVALYQTIAVHTALPASGASIRYAGGGDDPKAAVLKGDNFVLIQPTVLEPGRQVVVEVHSAWRTFQFTLYTREETGSLLDFYLLAIHDFYGRVSGPWAPAFVGLETAGMGGIEPNEQVVATRTLLAYSYTPYIHSERLAPGFVQLAGVDPLYSEFDLAGAPRFPGRTATARDGLVIAPILKEYRPGYAEVEVHLFTGPDPDTAYLHLAWLRYRGELKNGSWQIEPMD